MNCFQGEYIALASKADQLTGDFGRPVVLDRHLLAGFVPDERSCSGKLVSKGGRFAGLLLLSVVVVCGCWQDSVSFGALLCSLKLLRPFKYLGHLYERPWTFVPNIFTKSNFHV